MQGKYRPDVAYPLELSQEGEHFASGVNHPGEVMGLCRSARHFGITATEIRDGLLDACEREAGPMMRIFVDSGAFGEVAFDPTAGRLVVKKPITDASWIERFAIYFWAAHTFGQRAYLVAPDLVGDQAATFERLARWSHVMHLLAGLRAQIIVPVQKGALAMSAAWARQVEILGMRPTDLIAGVPMKKDATSLEDLRELCTGLPWFGARIHLLGIGPESPKFLPAIAAIKSVRPNAKITSDSVTVRRLVGRTNGRGNGPRVLTRYQDEARLAGATSSIEIKSTALTRQGFDELKAERELALELGWFDEEIYDTIEEARAHHAAGYPDIVDTVH